MLFLEGVPEATPIPEAPPIPCHVHAGEVCGGRCVGHGKTEAYFFPPLDVPPYNLQLEGKVSTRLGLKSGTTKQQVWMWCWGRGRRLGGEGMEGIGRCGGDRQVWKG